MELYLIRHGENSRLPEWYDHERNVLNGPLTKKGIEQANLLAARCRSIPFDWVQSSDLLRAVQTADIVCRCIRNICRCYFGHQPQYFIRGKCIGRGSRRQNRTYQCEHYPDVCTGSFLCADIFDGSGCGYCSCIDYHRVIYDELGCRYRF